MDEQETPTSMEQAAGEAAAYEPPTVETTENLPPQCSF